MTELSDWVQNNWLELGSLLAQVSIALALLWYGSKLVRILETARQEDHGRWGVPSAGAVRSDAGHTEHPEYSIGVGRRVVQWLREPMVSSGVTPWQKLARWLQAPAGS